MNYLRQYYWRSYNGEEHFDHAAVQESTGSTKLGTYGKFVRYSLLQIRYHFIPMIVARKDYIRSQQIHHPEPTSEPSEGEKLYIRNSS
jgi:hypothetical protein